jgi:small subunit ribosomal protein S9
MAPYTYAIGRRKTATARIKLFEGVGQDMINGKKAGDYVTRSDLFEILYAPLKSTKLKDKVFFEAVVEGSWISAQVDAIAFATSRAISSKDTTLRKILKSAELLTSDSRKVERKKPGHHKARKSTQWSKR